MSSRQDDTEVDERDRGEKAKEGTAKRASYRFMEINVTHFVLAARDHGADQVVPLDELMKKVGRDMDERESEKSVEPDRMQRCGTGRPRLADRVRKGSRP